MRYYAAFNTYGSETDIGFINAWNVLVFESKKTRDEYVDKHYNNRSVRAITREEIRKYVGKPKPFSGQARCIVPAHIIDPEDSLAGLVGQIVIDSNDLWERLTS